MMSKQIEIRLPKAEADYLRDYIGSGRSPRLARSVILNVAEGLILDKEVSTVDLNQYILSADPASEYEELKFRVSPKRNPYLYKLYESWDWGTRYENFAALICEVIAQLMTSDRWKRYVTISAQAKEAPQSDSYLPPPVVPDDEIEERRPAKSADSQEVDSEAEVYGVEMEALEDMDDSVFSELDFDDFDEPENADSLLSRSGGFE